VTTKPAPITIYSNIVNIRTTHNEVIFEFGTYFPPKTGDEPKGEFTPDARIVMSVQALYSLADVLAKEAQRHKQENKQASEGEAGPSIASKK
jgi:hypothetical protein